MRFGQLKIVNPVLKYDILKQVCSHIQSKAKDKGIYIDRVNGYDEHIHTLMLLKSDNSISKQMQLLKGESAFWTNRVDLLKAKLEWADKYFAASVSESRIDSVRYYMDNQQAHHKKQTFIEEYNHFIKSLGYNEADFG